MNTFSVIIMISKLRIKFNFAMVYYEDLHGRIIFNKGCHEFTNFILCSY